MNREITPGNKEMNRAIVIQLHNNITEYMTKIGYEGRIEERITRLNKFLFIRLRDIFSQETETLKPDIGYFFNCFDPNNLETCGNNSQRLSIFISLIIEKYIRALKIMIREYNAYESFDFHHKIKQFLIEGDLEWNENICNIVISRVDLFRIFNSQETRFVTKRFLQRWHPWSADHTIKILIPLSRIGICFERYIPLKESQNVFDESTGSEYHEKLLLVNSIAFELSESVEKDIAYSKLKTANKFINEINDLELLRLRDEKIRANKKKAAATNVKVHSKTKTKSKKRKFDKTFGLSEFMNELKLSETSEPGFDMKELREFYDIIPLEQEQFWSDLETEQVLDAMQLEKRDTPDEMELDDRFLAVFDELCTPIEGF